MTAEPPGVGAITPEAESAARADMEAVEWLVALQEAPGDARLRAAFDAWRKAAPVNADAWRETAGVYLALGDIKPVHAPSRRPVMALPNWRQLPWGARGPGWAGLAFAAMVLALVGPEAILRLRADAVTGLAQVQEVQLEDDSHVVLAPNSALHVAYTEGERHVRLLRGRAVFDVQSNPHRPFRVSVNGVDTTVLGTVFEVGAHSEETRVAVAQGLVLVEQRGDPAATYQLAAGQAVYLNAGAGAEDVEVAPDDVAAWRDGRLAVQDRPMREVVQAVRDWHRGVIILRSGSLADRRVTGVYDLSDPAAAMDALARAYDGRVTHITPWIMVVSDT